MMAALMISVDAQGELIEASSAADLAEFDRSTFTLRGGRSKSSSKSRSKSKSKSRSSKSHHSRRSKKSKVKVHLGGGVYGYR